MTSRTERAAKLEAEAKAMRRAEKAFWTEVEDRLDEVKEHFSLVDVSDTYTSKPDGRDGALF